VLKNCSSIEVRSILLEREKKRGGYEKAVDSNHICYHDIRSSVHQNEYRWICHFINSLHKEKKKVNECATIS
jgi:hypothetical protein